MGTIKKLVSILLVVCMLLPLLAGCGKKPASTAQPQQQTPVSESGEAAPENKAEPEQEKKEEEEEAPEAENLSEAKDSALSVAEFLKILAELLSVDISPYVGKSNYTDVPKENEFAPYTVWAAEKGLIEKGIKAKLNPDEKITKERAAAIVVRLLNAYSIPFPANISVNSPADYEKISADCVSSVMELWNSGMTKPDGKGNFNPKNTLTKYNSLFSAIKKQIKIADSMMNITVYNTSYVAPKFWISFESNGGGELSKKALRPNENLKGLPTPYKENTMFYGWYYDDALTKRVSENDVITSNLTLYAKYMAIDGLSEKETPYFGSALEQGTDFTFVVNDKSGALSAAGVLAGITAENLGDPKETGIISVSALGGGKFSVSGKHHPLGNDKPAENGFAEGKSYKFTLTDENLSFEGYAEEAREYSLTTKKETVYNLKLNGGMTFIPFVDISDIQENGESVRDFSAAAPIGAGSGVDKMAKGSFVYTKANLNIGDTVCIFEGEDPQTRGLDDVENEDAGAITYVEIKSINGDRYGYETADAENVLFTPDVLPLKAAGTAESFVVAGDSDENPEDGVIVLPETKFDFSDEMFKAANLDEATTVDTGDYLAFYTGEIAGGESLGYAVITEVSEKDGYYTIAYEEVSVDEMLQAMSMYYTDPLSGEEMLEGADPAKVEASVEQQALRSGFAEQAGQYLAALVLETDSFTTLSNEIELSSYEIESGNGALRAARTFALGGVKPAVEVREIKASIGSRNLDKFDGVSGLHCDLTIDFKITVPSGDSQVVVNVAATFVEELKINVNVGGDADWKWFGIIPYIAEYTVTASVDIYDYTEIQIDATMISQKRGSNGAWLDDVSAKDVGKELKRLLESVADGNAANELEASDRLIEKYKKMLENETDWVEIIDEELFEKSVRIKPIMVVVVGINVDFVVSGDLNIALGVEFYYINAKRYTYNVEVFSKNVSNDTLNLVEEKYEFTFYAMGKLGLRVGVRAEIYIALISDRVGKVGVSAEAGVYIKIWGYFYYNVKYTESAGRETKSAGGLYTELGIYLDIKFIAEAIGGRYAYDAKIFEREWPVWTAGMRENVLNFTYEQYQAPDIHMKKIVLNTVLPEEIFEMKYLDLYTGKGVEKAFDEVENGEFKYFVVELTNPAFSFNPETKTITVEPGEEKELKGEMVITWKGSPRAFTNVTITRTISIAWDNYNDGYSIVFNSNGGSFVPMIVKAKGSLITAPEEPERKGYDFDGWYSDGDFAAEYTVPAEMPDSDANVFAKWVPKNDTSYTVEHYIELLGKTGYELSETENLAGTTAAEVTPAVKEYEGFSAPAAKKIAVLADGTALVRYYYARKTNTLTFDMGAASEENIVKKLKFEAAITAPVPSAAGYDFLNWNEAVAEKMGSSDLTYTASWVPHPDTPYIVENWTEQLDGNIILDKLSGNKGVTDSSVGLNDVADAEYAGKYDLEKIEKVGGGGEIKIAGDGSLSVKATYKLKTYTLKFDLGDGKIIESALKAGTPLTAPQNPEREGYSFAGWDTPVAAKMPAYNVTYTAKWTAKGDSLYAVLHYTENAEDENYSLAHTEIKTGAAGENVSAGAKTFEGFSLDSEASGTIASGTVLSGDGLVLKLYYKRDTYKVNYVVDSEPYGEEETFKQGQKLTYSAAPVKSAEGGSTEVFDCWIGGDGKVFGGYMPEENIVLTAKWRDSAESPRTVAVNYLQENLNGEFTLIKSEEESVSSGSAAEIVPAESYVGFATPAEASFGFADPGYSLDLKYMREKSSLTWNLGGGTPRSSCYTAAGEIKFGAQIVAPVLKKAGGSYTWDKAPAETMGTGAQEYTAVWESNRYAVKFNPNGGTGSMAEMSFTYGDAQRLAACSFKRENYNFAGWSMSRAGEKKFGDGQSVSNLAAADGAEVTLYALWSPVSYEINYELGGGTNHPDNQNSYTHVSGNIYLRKPTKTGYTFLGWFGDEGFSNPAGSFAIKAGSTGERTFFAKWEPNRYAVLFDKNTGDGTDAPVQFFTYDAEQQLMKTTYARDGYNFLGWAKESGAKTALYTDEQSVKNIIDKGKITLYAVWEPIRYPITYNLGIGTGNSNPVDYTIEDEVILAEATISGDSGYVFVGWYTTADFKEDSKVVSIPRGSMGEREFFAKWANYGIFSITKGSGAGEFKISRNGDEGAQTVNFRTLNGTAIGTVNFSHRNGATGMVQFAEGVTEQTITVNEIGGLRPYTSPDGAVVYPATKYTAADGYNLTYYVQITSVSGGAKIGTNSTAKRTMSNGENIYIPEESYTFGEYDAVAVGFEPGSTTVNKSDSSQKHICSLVSAAGNEYFENTASGKLFKYSADVKNLIPQNGAVMIIAEGTKAISHYLTFLNETYNGPISLPRKAEPPIIPEPAIGMEPGYENKTIGDEMYLSVPATTKELEIAFNFSEGSLTWKIDNGKYRFKVVDDEAPEFLGIAKIAEGEYSEGDKIRISLVFSEIIADRGSLSVSVDGIGGLTYKEGTGTCVLSFEGTVGKGGFSPEAGGVVSEDMFSLTGAGTVRDISGN